MRVSYLGSKATNATCFKATQRLVCIVTLDFPLKVPLGESCFGCLLYWLQVAHVVSSAKYTLLLWVQVAFVAFVASGRITVAFGSCCFGCKIPTHMLPGVKSCLG